MLYKHKESVEKLVSTHDTLRIAQNGLLELQIVHFLFSMPVVYRPHPLYWYVQMQLRMVKLSEGKGRQIITTVRSACSGALQYYPRVATEHAAYVL